MKSDIELNNCAIKLRTAWGEDAYSPVDIFKLASLQNDLTLVTMEMPSTMSGICVRSGSEIIIAINSTMSLGRQRFTLAHELYHAYYDDALMTYVCMQSFAGKKSESEKEADKFASFFLAPYSALDIYENQKASDGWNLESIVIAEQFYGISHQAMLVRLVSEHRITQSRYDELKGLPIKTVAEKMGLELDLYRNTLNTKPYSCTGSYLRKIQEAYDRGLIGESKRDELMNDGFADSSIVLGDIIND